MSKALQRVRGTQDILPDLEFRFNWIREQARHLGQIYGFSGIETPLFEMSEVFHRTLGESSDMVHKETYTFLDRGGDSITLRPEGTAGIARAFIQEGLAQNLPLKFFYAGAMFRYERPQKGRYRQFHQIGMEALGYDHPFSDVESIQYAADFLDQIGIKSLCQLHLNTLGDGPSREIYREKLVQYFTQFKNDLSADSQMRLEKNPLRILDSKDPKDQKLIPEAPKMAQSLNDHSRKFFDRLLNGLTQLGIEYTLDTNLVRGIDYYTHTVFEFITQKLGAQGTVLAGGRYDGLIQSMGGPATPGVGWAAGLERLAELVPADRLPQKKLDLAVIPADEAGETWALTVAHALRKKGRFAEIIWNGNVGKKMKKAASLQAQFALIVGSTEASQKSVTFKNMSTGEQKSLSLDQLLTSGEV
ncbi:MAG: histidine--tRNA ligase [Bdellovibrionales bacterium]